jgi:O-antigen/teichoic acid export membrane protein
MTRAKATAEGYLWNHAGKVLEYLLLFFTTVLIARGLGVEANGIFATLVSFAQLLVVLSSLSLESSLNRFIPQLDATKQGNGAARLRFLLRRIFLARAGLLVGFVVLGFILVQLSPLPVPGAVTRYFWLLAGYAAVRSFVQLVSMVFVAQLQTAPLARIAVAFRAIEMAGIAGMMAIGMSVASVMHFLISTGILQIGTCFYVGRSDFLGEMEPHPLRSLFVFGAIYWTNAIFEYFLGRQGDVLFLTTLLSTPVSASTYNVAFSVVLVAVQGMTLGLGGITLTTFSRVATTSPETLERFYGFLVRIVSVLVVPVLIFVFFNAGQIITIIFSQEFAGAAILVQGMVVFRVVARLFAGSENAEYLLVSGQTVSVVQIGIIGAASNILLDVMLIPRYLAFGAVIGSGCANLLVNILGSLYVRRHAGHPIIQWSYWGLMTLSAIFSGVLTTYILSGDGWAFLLARGAAFGLLTTFFLYLAKPLPALDIVWVKEIDESLARIFSRFTRKHGDTMMEVS